MSTSSIAPSHLARPKVEDRAFCSQAVEETIEAVTADISGELTKRLFRNCFPNTLDTTVRLSKADGKPDTFVITGDIDAMWLRDSAAQVWPYLPLCARDSQLSELVAGVIGRQARSVLIDPYANAFNEGPTVGKWASDLTDTVPGVYERKWEVDSLCYVIRLSYGYWKQTSRTDPFDAEWQRAMEKIVETFREQQRIDSPGPYRFMRETPIATDTAPSRGFGNPTRATGMIHSMFRPSDDACIFPYLVPSNMFAVVELTHLAEMSRTILGADALADQAIALAAEVEAGIRQYAVRTHPEFGEIFAYEADGYENVVFMDDANVPSLLSLPYLGYCDAEDPIYQNTRSFVLSKANPYYFKGQAGEGVGGPHVGLGYIWPMAIIMRALTSTEDAEIAECLLTLAESSAGTGFMHESFLKDDAADFTRSWFAWANTLFGELILKVRAERPHLLAQLP